MKKFYPFSKLPQGLSTKELREEIRRRILEAEKMGMLRKPRK